MYAVGIFAAAVNSVTIIYCARAFQTSFSAEKIDEAMKFRHFLRCLWQQAFRRE